MNNKLPEWRKTLNKAVENYQSMRAWYEENPDNPSAEQDMDAAEGDIEKLLKQYGVLIVLNLLDEIDELQERRKADSEPAGYHVIKECGKVGCSVATLEEAEKTRDFWNKKWTIRPYFYSVVPAPVVPETLPCSVELKPGLIIGKGCKTEILLTALKRRADYYAELEAMTPEERAERDAGIEAFKAMLPTPADSQGRPRAPVVPEDISGIIERFQYQADHLSDWHHIDEHSCKVNRRDLMTALEFMDSCRAAMLQMSGNSEQLNQAPVKQPSSDEVIGWLRSDYNSDDKRDPNAPLFMLGSNDPSEAWGVKYIPLSGNSPVIPGVYLVDINTDHQH
ncbi:hypothetical protein GYC91_001832 [Salmonella enterica]|nr:hypothetical protein [Salmonella enterica]ECC9948722.1 hypothetical protein [Salmonella enterica subsp. houtenae]EDU9325488.1 hypothetical protein [Salmonella enterica subsp. enterica]EEE1667295.1 hypothetical protein [Salmonella enterica subsp. houtenae serovar 48:z4,z32:-]EAO1932871.1 hypothetical protein [Salmonella enterica]